MPQCYLRSKGYGNLTEEQCISFFSSCGMSHDLHVRFLNENHKQLKVRSITPFAKMFLKFPRTFQSSRARGDWRICETGKVFILCWRDWVSSTYIPYYSLMWLWQLPKVLTSEEIKEFVKLVSFFYFPLERLGFKHMYIQWGTKPFKCLLKLDCFLNNSGTT